MKSDRLLDVVHTVDPEGVSRRRNDLQRTRGEYIAPGPIYVWSIDGHDKLSHWGFQIYASIDAYSRFITWLYVGISNRAAFSILRQFLDTLETEKIQPRYIRSDKGSETVYLAAAHCALYRKIEEQSQIADCYWYGTSTSNQRIEGWWLQLTKSLLFIWRVGINPYWYTIIEPIANPKIVSRITLNHFLMRGYSSKILQLIA